MLWVLKKTKHMLKLMGKKIFTPADNTGKRAWQYIETDRKKERKCLFI